MDITPPADAAGSTSTERQVTESQADVVDQPPIGEDTPGQVTVFPTADIEQIKLPSRAWSLHVPGEHDRSRGA